MPGTRIFIASFVLFAGLAAAATDYMPFEPGNLWIYRAGTQTMSIEVLRTEVAGGRAYSVVREYRGDSVWLRMDDAGSLWAYDPATGREALWAAFNSPEGTEYDTVVDACSHRARIASRATRYSGPVGEFDSALRIVYSPTGCADAGISEELYLPWVGLVRRTLTTIAGPVNFDLIYARLGGVTQIAAGGISMGLWLDRAVYTVNLMPPVDPQRTAPELAARLALANGTDAPLELVFPSGQNYDLVIRNAKDEIVYRWSDGRFFTMIYRRETLAPRRERAYAVVVRLADKTGAPLPQGLYTAEAWFTTEGGKRYAATAGFEIKYVY
jgi:hypothetical protein